LSFHLGQFLGAFRIALTEFPDLLLRDCKLLLQIILLGDERLKTLF